jgi:hypothetical protein
MSVGAQSEMVIGCSFDVVSMVHDDWTKVLVCQTYNDLFVLL